MVIPSHTRNENLINTFNLRVQSTNLLKPILTYLKNLFAFKRILGDEPNLIGLAEADVLLSNLVNQKKVPGLAITVFRDRQVLFQKGYGYANMNTETPVDPKNTIFRIGSISKPIAATALAKMVEEGTIALDNSFYDYVPYYPKKAHDFSIRQLAAHTSGIRGYEGKEYALNKPYSIKESIKIFKDDPLLYVPGEYYIYNTFDWVLISLAMEEASGISFEEYVKTRVLEPLGLDKIQAEIPAEPAENMANFYSKFTSGFREAIAVDNRWKLAGGGYLSTSEDLARFGQAYLDQKIADQKVLSQFLASNFYNNTPTWYGLGWEVSEDRHGRPFYGHTGNGVGVHSRFYVYPNEQMVFSILINCTRPKVQDELDEVIDVLINTELSAITGEKMV